MKPVNLQKLFNKPMNRREFLAHIGAGALMIMGISGLLGRLVDIGSHPRQHTGGGYGSSPYGGGSKQ